MMKSLPLPDFLRPETFDDVVGQDHLFGEKGTVRRMLSLGRINNMIFFGPPGTGKTTSAQLIAKQSGMTFYKLNATSASLNDVKAILAETENVFGSNGILLYLDEIQYFNKKQQQSLLEYIEDGRITLIASTTDNPHFSVYNALLSRCALYEFKPVDAAALLPVVKKAVDFLNGECKENKTVPDGIALYIGGCAKGDVRHAIVLTENAYYASEGEITKEAVDSFDTSVFNFNDDTHFDLLSCLQKSIRGSDPDAAVFYMTKLLKQGELLSVCRRLQVIASEDIGLAYPMGAVVTRSCVESAKELGMPEAGIPLAHAVVLLATAPKSNSANAAYEAASEALESGLGKEVPKHLQSPLFQGYQYPHAFPNHYVRQQYLPTDIKGRRFYVPAENKLEQAAKEYWDKIKNK